ncbi:MAG: HD domain-containing phosphohydrolase [Acidiferrobacterales bacterium]
MLESINKEWETTLDAVDILIFTHDRQFRVRRCNKAYQRCAGIPYQQIIGQLYYEIFPKAPQPMKSCLNAFKGGGKEVEELQVGDKIYSSNSFVVKDSHGNYLYSVHTMEDVTERKRVASELIRSETHFRMLYESSRDAIMLATLEPGYRYISGNPAAVALFGCRDEHEFILQTPVSFSPELQPDGRSSDEHALEIAQVLQSTGGHFFEWLHKRMDGTTFPAEVLLTATNIDGKQVVLASVRDITIRKDTEKALKHSLQAFRALSAVNHNLVYASDEQLLLENICHSIVDNRNYLLAWVGYVQYDEYKSIKVMAHGGHDQGYTDKMQLTWAESDHGLGPSGQAIRNRTTQLVQDITTDPRYLPWRDAATEQGYAATVSFPLLNENNSVFGVLNVYAGEANAFVANEVDLLEQMAVDLSFGVSALRTRHQRDLALEQSQQHQKALKDSLEGTIQAMARLVEMRDPYTAGHQERVADLAEAIARQLGLPDEKVHAIHLGATVHDLGKIKIPAEILSKPGRLNELEIAMVRTHAQAGFDILKDIPFPWPIANMIFQHHERMDGSGYPQGLKGDAILLEARILAVADVVEAMASHRPYRAGLGIEAALTEITVQSGTHYDPVVVEACLVLFNTHHYSLKKVRTG